MNQTQFDAQAPYPSEEVIAIFADAKMIAVKSVDDSLIYASLTHLCEALGLDVEDQIARIDDHAVLAEGLRNFNLHTGNVHGRSLMTAPCLRTNLIPVWLKLISQEALHSVKRLKQEGQEKILLFQSQAADALDRLFGPDQPFPAKTNVILVSRISFGERPPEAERAEQLRQRIMREL